MDDCLLWEMSVKTNGYGQTFSNGKNTAPHIMAWEIFYGPVPEGKILDHICHTEAAIKGLCKGGKCIHRRCYNPHHLRVVTYSENTRAGLHCIDVKTTCPKGHSYRDKKNIMIRKSGQRECAECNRQRANANYYKNKSKVRI